LFAGELPTKLNFSFAQLVACAKPGEWSSLYRDLIPRGYGAKPEQWRNLLPDQSALDLQIDLNNNSTVAGDEILQNTRSFSSLSQRWAMTKSPDGTWKISNIFSGLCLDSTGRNKCIDGAKPLV
jgi:hypothetical protein